MLLLECLLIPRLPSIQLGTSRSVQVSSNSGQILHLDSSQYKYLANARYKRPFFIKRNSTRGNGDWGQGKRDEGRGTRDGGYLLRDS